MHVSQPADSFVLTLDIGTSSVRAMLFDKDARAVPGLEARVETIVHTTADGGVEMEPMAVIDGVMRCIDEILSLAGPRASQIIGVGCDTLVSNIVGIDNDGTPITPLYTWADTRSGQVAAELRAIYDEAAIHDRTGCLLRSSYLPAQLRWLRQAQPDLVERVVRWVSIGELLHVHLFGRATVSYSVASWTGLLDRRRLQWDEQMLQLAGITPDNLSPLGDRDHPVSGLLASYARRWPVLSQIPWFPAVGDGVASNTGCGCVQPDRIALALGTSGALRVMVEQDVTSIPYGLWSYRVDRRRSLVGGALSEGGNLWAWLRESLVSAKSDDEVEAQMAELIPDSHGLTFLPFLAGERSPGWHSAARATISGIGLHTQPIEIIRAGLESIGYSFKSLAGLVKDAVPGTSAIVASGAPLRSELWAQILADVLQLPLTVSDEAEATSRGVAVLTLEALGQIQNLDDLPAASGRLVSPVEEYGPIYQAGFERRQDLYDLLVNRAGLGGDKEEGKRQ